MPIKQVKKVTGTKNVSKKSGATGATTEEEVAYDVGESEMEGPVARVRYSNGATVNLGDFNSGRVDVEIELPCSVTEEDLNSTYDFAKKWVEEKVQQEIDEMTGDGD